MTRGFRLTAIRLAILALPFALSLFVLPVDSPFLLPKRALLVVAAALLCGTAAATGALRMPSGRDARLVSVLAALATLAVFASGAISPQFALGLPAALFWLAGPLLAIVVCTAIDEPTSLGAAIAIAGGIQSAIVTMQWAAAVNPAAIVGVHVVARDRMRLFGTLGNPDFVATFVAATLPFVLMRVLGDETRASVRMRWLWRALVVLDLVAIAATGARTVGAAAIAALAVTVWFTPGTRHRRARFTWPLSLVGILSAATALVLLTQNPRRLDESFAGRATIWRVALSGHTASITGSGPGTFSRTYDVRMSANAGNRREPGRERFFAYEQTALNDYVQALVETGWFGALTLVGGLGSWICVVARRAVDPAGDPSTGASCAAALGCVAALATAALGESPFQRADTWALFWIALALPFASPHAVVRLRPGATWRRAMAVPILLASLAAVWLATRPVVAAWWVQQGIDAESSLATRAAIDAYRRAVSFDGTSATAWFNLSRLLLRTGDYEAAWRASDEAFQLRPEPEVALLRVRILEAKGAGPYALRELARAVKTFPWRTELLIEARRLTGSTTASPPR